MLAPQLPPAHSLSHPLRVLVLQSIPDHRPAIIPSLVRAGTRSVGRGPGFVAARPPGRGFNRPFRQ